MRANDRGQSPGDFPEGLWWALLALAGLIVATSTVVLSAVHH